MKFVTRLKRWWAMRWLLWHITYEDEGPIGFAFTPAFPPDPHWDDPNRMRFNIMIVSDAEYREWMRDKNAN